MNEDIAKFLDTIREATLLPQVDLATHEPTTGELNNITYLSMKYVAGWPMRDADFIVCSTMGVGNLQTFQEAVASYTWDHIMGEPDTPTEEEILTCVKAITDHLYGMDEKTRNAV